MNRSSLFAAATLTIIASAPVARAQIIEEPDLPDAPDKTNSPDKPDAPDAPNLPDDPEIMTTAGPGGVNLGHDRNDPSWAKFASNTGNLIFLSAGVLLPLVTDGKAGAQHSIRTADSLIVSTAFAEGLKQVVHKKRPDGTDYKSFPSGHATAAFTVATMQASYHPKQAIFWYAGASAIAASRVTLRRHDTVDVIGGALLGYGTARLELAQKRGLVLRPFIREVEPRNRVTGVSFSRGF